MVRAMHRNQGQFIDSSCIGAVERFNSQERARRPRVANAIRPAPKRGVVDRGAGMSA